jgi:hypothetical protein
MITVEAIALCNTILTIITLTVTYFNFRHSRKKDFQNKLFQIKLDAYKDLSTKCYDAYLTLDINSTPFNEIYKIETKEDWDSYFVKEITPLYQVGFKLQKSIYAYAYLLPDNIIEQYYAFSNLCLSLVTSSAHFDTELIINNSDQLFEDYVALVKLIKQDLKIEVINKGLLNRVSHPFM